MKSNLSYSSETLNSRQKGRFFSCVTLKFDGWPWRTIGHLFYVSSSLVHDFIAISEFKHELQSGDAQFRSKSMIFCSAWPWNLRNMTFKNNKAPLLCGYFKLCTLFCSRWWIQTGVTKRKRPIWFRKTIIFLVVWPWNLMDDLEKQWDTFSKQHQAFFIISSSYVNSNWSYCPETAKLGFDPCDLELWPLTLTFCMDITFVKLPEKFMMIRWQEHCEEGVTDGRTGRRTDGQKCS